MEEKGFTITNTHIEPINSPTLEQCIALSFQAIRVFFNKILESVEDTDKQTELAAQIHDEIVLQCSALANEIYPQAAENEENFVSFLDDKIEQARNAVNK